MRAADEHILMVELERPTGCFLYLLTYNVSFPVPRHAVEKHGEAWAKGQNIVINGLFRLEDWSQDEVLSLARNPDYHGRFTGNVERAEVHLLPDAAARLEAYETGRLDTLALPNTPAVRERARQRNAGEHLSAPLLATTNVGFDTSRPPFDDPQVRCAFAAALHRERWADAGMGGYAFPATGGFVPSGMPGYSAEIGTSYDPDEAQRLVAEAGYPAGGEFPLVEFVTDQGYEPLSQYLVSQRRENLGIEVSWKTLARAGLLATLEDTPPDVFSDAWYADYLDPDNFLRVCDAVRWTRWQNEHFQGLVGGARQVLDQRERMEMYHRADKVLVDEAPIIPLTYWRSYLLMKPWIRKFPTSAAKSWFWKDIVVEPHD